MDHPLIPLDPKTPSDVGVTYESLFNLKDVIHRPETLVDTAGATGINNTDTMMLVDIDRLLDIIHRHIRQPILDTKKVYTDDDVDRLLKVIGIELNEVLNER